MFAMLEACNSYTAEVVDDDFQLNELSNIVNHW